MTNKQKLPGLCAMCVVGSLFLGFTAGSGYAGETSNKITANKISSNRIAANRLVANKLSSNKITANGLQANLDTSEILQTEDGREVYSYMISCALPAGKTIEADIPDAADTAPPDTLYSCKNGHCGFPGSIGLAEHWIDRALSPRGQRWVTACLLARVNAYGVSVKISLRGDAPSLSVSPDEAAKYTLQEGAFYGNIFGDPEKALDWNACRGKNKLATPDAGDLKLRACTEPDRNDPSHTQCGFNYAGDCGAFGKLDPASVPTRACKTFESDEGTYSDCTAPAENGFSEASKTYREVITTYVKH